MLGTETGGKNPSQASEVVAPVVDMTRLYDGQALSIEAAGGTPAAIGETRIISVPQNEAWIIYGVGFNQTVVVVTDGILVSFAIDGAFLSGDSGFHFVARSPDMIATGLSVGNSSLTFSHQFPVPFQLAGGGELVMKVEDASNFRFNTVTWLVAKFDA